MKAGTILALMKAGTPVYLKTRLQFDEPMVDVYVSGTEHLERLLADMGPNETVAAEHTDGVLYVGNWL